MLTLGKERERANSSAGIAGSAGGSAGAPAPKENAPVQFPGVPPKENATIERRSKATASPPISGAVFGRERLLATPGVCWGRGRVGVWGISALVFRVNPRCQVSSSQPWGRGRVGVCWGWGTLRGVCGESNVCLSVMVMGKKPNRRTAEFETGGRVGVVGGRVGGESRVSSSVVNVEEIVEAQ